jgi:hypothetical protein
MSLRLAATALAAVAAAAVPAVASATPATLGPYPVNVNAHVSVDSTAAQCDNTGSTINIGGSMTFDGLGQDVLFENRAVVPSSRAPVRSTSDAASRATR